MDPGLLDRLRTVSIGRPTSGSPAGQGVIRRQLIEVKKGSKGKVSLDTDEPKIFLDTIIQLKRDGGKNNTNDSIIRSFLDELKKLAVGNPALTLLHGQCVDVDNLNFTDFQKEHPPAKAAKKVTASVPAETKAPSIKYKDLKKEGKKAALAELWKLPESDDRFKAAISSQKSFTFMSGLDPEKQRKMIAAKLSKTGLESAVALITEPPTDKPEEMWHTIRCLRHETMTPKDKALVRGRWLTSIRKLSVGARPTYQARVEAALDDPKTYEYFRRLSEEERLYLDDESFGAKQPLIKKRQAEFDKTRTQDQQKASGERKSLADKETAEWKRQQLVGWDEMATRIRGDVRNQVQRAGFDDTDWTAVVDPELTSGRGEVEDGQPANAQANLTEGAIRRGVINMYFARVVAQTWANLKPERQRAVKEQMKDDPTKQVDDTSGALKAAWLQQLNPGENETWATLLGLRLKHTVPGNDFHRLPTNYNLGAHAAPNPAPSPHVHFSVGVEGINPEAKFTDGMTARELVDRVFGSGTADPRERVHVTLETNVTRTPGGRDLSLPHKHWFGDYDFYFKYPEPPGLDSYNKWNREQVVNNNPALTTRRTAGEAIVRAALDHAYPEMVTELVRRAQHLLTTGNRNPTGP